MTFRCDYCGHEFKRESSLVAHMCKYKKRWLQKDNQSVRMGLKFFNDWYQVSMGASGNKTYDEFIHSQYYSAFVRFGQYVLDARIFAPERYLDWLVKEQISIDRWCKDSIYSKYLADQNKHETADRALERFVLHAERWSERTGFHWNMYWNQAQPHVIVEDIRMGRVSPWVFLSYNAARERLDGMVPELLNDIAETVDLGYWQRRIQVNQPTVKWINEILNAS